MRLILLRHAKSAWNTDASTDHARPLNKRGQRDAPRVGSELHARGWIPEVVLCSDAARTTETWARMGPMLAPGAPVIHRHDLYHAGVAQLTPLLATRTEETVLVIGHNPGIEEMLLYFSGQDRQITTANAALLTTAARRWDQAGHRAWTLVDLIQPRALQ